MGRRKISIAPISDDRNRQVTFLKRKNGLFKKAYELGVLCSADVAVVVFNANGKLFEFHSGDMDTILLRYSHYAGPPHEKRGPQDYINKDLLAQEAASKSSKMGGKMMNASAVGGDDDDEDDEGFEDDDRALLGEEGMEDLGGGEEGAEGSSGVMTMAQHERIRQSSTTSNGPPPVASGSGSGSSAGKKVVEGKGKQAVVAAKAREKRNGSVSDNGTIEPPLPPQSQSQSRPPSNESRYSSQPQPPNYPPPYPATSSNSNPSSDYPPYSLPPPSNPHNQQPNPYSFLSGFPPPPNQYAPSNHFPSQFPQHPPHQHPHGLPPPPNPADLFSMGLFGNAPPPPGMIPNNNSSSQNGGGVGNPMNFFGGPQGGGGGNFNFGGGPPGGGGYPNPFGTNFPIPGYPSSSNTENSQGGGGGGGVPNWFGSSNPMLAALAQQQRAEATAHWHQQRQSLMIDQNQNPVGRPISRTSNSRQSPEQPQQQRAPSRQDSNGSTSTSASKPRLIVAIPRESNVEEGRKKGLVTAGGASILGRGFEGKGEGNEVEENTEKEGEGRRQDEEDEESQPTAVPRSAFASDLIAASPFYPPSSQPPQNPYSYPTPSSGPPPSNFGWPSSSSQPPPNQFRPAPMLGESDAPDLIRDSPDPIAENGEGEREETVRRLKRPSVDLEDGMEGLEVEGNGDGVNGNGKEEDGEDRRKRRA